MSAKLTIPVFLLLFSCSDGERKIRIAKVDSLILVVNALEVRLDKVDTVRVERSFREIQDELRYIDSLYASTKELMAKETAIFFSDYRLIGKSFQKARSGRRRSMQEIGLAKKQLSDLRADMENGLLPEEQFSEYYTSELRAVDNLSQAVGQLTDLSDTAASRYEKMRTHVLHFTDSLRETVKIDGKRE